MTRAQWSFTLSRRYARMPTLEIRCRYSVAMPILDNGLRRRIPRWAITLAVLLCLLIALLGANFAYAELTKRVHVLSGRAGDLLYAATFSEFTEDWELYAGQQSAQITNAQLELRVGAPQTATWSTAPFDYAGFDVRVEAVAQDGPIDNAFGVIFHLKAADESRCDMPAVVLCGVEQLFPLAGAAIRQVVDSDQSRRYFAFLISSDGYYSVWENDGGVMGLISAWIASPRINQGLNAANRIRVLARQNAYQFFINDARVPLCIPDEPTAASTFVGGECIDGSMQDAYQETSPQLGKLGVIVQSTATGGGGVTIRFDNFVVSSPADTNEGDIEL